MACGHNCGCHHCSSGLGAYGPVPPLGQHGFRLAIPGGPRGGQFHGRVDANPIDPIYRGGRAANLTGRAHPSMPDPFHRAPGEVPPRPNAAGELNITGIDHEKASPGFAMVPGGLFPVGGFGIGGLGAKAPLNIMKATPPHGFLTPAHGPIPIDWIPWQPQPLPWWRPPFHLPVMPGPGGSCPPGMHYGPMPDCPPFAMCISACQPNVVTTWPPSGWPQPAPYTGAPCPRGQYQDAAGNCTDIPHYPYPVPKPPQPSPTTPGPTTGTPSAGQPGCVGGQLDASGNCIPSTVPGATPSWFTDPGAEVIPGVPNWGLLAGAGVAAYLMFGRGGRR